MEHILSQEVVRGHKVFKHGCKWLFPEIRFAFELQYWSGCED